MALQATWTKETGEISPNAYIKITQVEVISIVDPCQIAVSFYVYFDEQAKLDGKPPITNDGINTTFQSSDSLSYVVLYGMLKALHPQLSSAIDV